MAKKEKKEKLVDLTSKPEKVNDDQLKRIKSAINRINQTQMNIGQLESQKHQALHFIAGVNDEMTLIQNELQEEYGTFDVNIQDGIINYPPETPNQKENGKTDKKD